MSTGLATEGSLHQTVVLGTRLGATGCSGRLLAPKGLAFSEGRRAEPFGSHSRMRIEPGTQRAVLRSPTVCFSIVWKLLWLLFPVARNAFFEWGEMPRYSAILFRAQLSVFRYSRIGPFPVFTKQITPPSFHTSRMP